MKETIQGYIGIKVKAEGPVPGINCIDILIPVPFKEILNRSNVHQEVNSSAEVESNG